VFPDVDGEEGDVAGVQVGGQVLVLRLSVLEQARVFIVEQPTPAGALEGSRVLVEVQLEGLNGAPLAVEEISELGAHVGDGTTTVLNGGEGLPEELVVQVATAIEFNGVGEGDVLLHVSGCEGFGSLHLQFVVVVDISSVMLAVMELHQVTTDDGLKGSQVVREGLEVDNGRLSGGRESSLADLLEHVVSIQFTKIIITYFANPHLIPNFIIA